MELAAILAVAAGLYAAYFVKRCPKGSCQHIPNLFGYNGSIVANGIKGRTA